MSTAALKNQLAVRMGEPLGLDGALSELGPNPLTDFADELVIEGFRRSRKFTAMWESIGRFREALVDFLEGIDHAFIGGVAARSYSARLGPTEDFDVLIDAGDLKAITAFMEKQGFRWTGASDEGETDFFYSKPLRFHMDVRRALSPMDREALSKARPASFRGRKLRLVRPEHLAAMKVKSYSERKDTVKGKQDAEDVRGLLTVKATTVSDVRDVLRRRRPDLLPALEEIREKPANG